MPKVSMRGGFSDRNSIKPQNTEIQIKKFDKRTRIQLQNMISQMYIEVYNHDLYYGCEHIQNFLIFVLGTVYSEPIDTRKEYLDNPVIDMINSTILNDEYDDVLTLIEAIVQYWDSYLKNNKYQLYYNEMPYVKSVYEEANKCFEREYIGYRFIDGIIVPISDSYEIDAVQEAININQYIHIYRRLIS